MIKILLLCHNFYPDIGGIESVSEMMAGSFTKSNHTVKVLTWTKEPGKKDFPYDIVRSPRISQLVDYIMWADIVFENNPCLRLSWPNLFIRKPQLTALHTWITRTSGQKTIVDYAKIKLLENSYFVTACSSAVRDKCYPGAVVVTNPYKNELFRRIDSIEKSKELVFLGRLVSDKGVNTLIQAFYQILRNNENKPNIFPSTLTIIGDGPERLALEEQVRTLGIADNVVFTGSLRDNALVDELNRHRILVIPSLWEEPFGVVVLEGMACGCVPVVSNVGGLPDAIGKAGLTFERGNVQSMAATICSVLDNRELENKLRLLANDHLAAHHQDIIAGLYLNLFDKAINKTSVSHRQ